MCDKHSRGETREITIEVNERIAERMDELAWEFGATTDEIVDECCRYGARNYEDALGLRTIS